MSGPRFEQILLFQGERHSPFANAWPRVPFKGPRFKSGFLRVTHQVTLCPLLEGVAAAFKALSTLVAPIHLRPEKSPQLPSTAPHAGPPTDRRRRRRRVFGGKKGGEIW